MDFFNFINLQTVITSVVTSVILGLGVALLNARVKMSGMHDRIKHLEDVRMKNIEDEFKVFKTQQGALLQDISAMKQQIINIERTADRIEKHLLQQSES